MTIFKVTSMLERDIRAAQVEIGALYSKYAH